MVFGILFWTFIDIGSWHISHQYILRGLLMYFVAQRTSMVTQSMQSFVAWSFLACELFLIYGSSFTVFLNILLLIFMFQQAQQLLNKNSWATPGIIGTLSLLIEPVLMRFILNIPIAMNHFTLGGFCVNLALLYVILGTRGNRA